MPLNYSNALVDPHSAAQANVSQITGIAPGAQSKSALELMFGPPSISSHSRSAYSTTHENVYDLYEGDNLYMADTIKGFMLLNREWETSVIPWLQTNQMEIVWNEFHFDRTLAGPVPSSGIQRLLTHHKEKKSARIMRYGIAFRLEGDVIGTAEGLVLFRRNLAGLVQSCTEMVNFHTMAELQQCKVTDRELQNRFREPGYTMEKIAQIEAENFAVLALDRGTFATLVQKERSLMLKHHNADIDTIIVPHNFQYDENANGTMATPTYTEYYQTSPTGAMVPVAGPISEGNYRGIPMHASRSFSAYSSGPMLDPLLSNVSVGEYYITNDDMFKGLKTMPSTFTNDMFSIYIYSGDSGTDKKITFQQMFEHSNLFGGNADDPTGPCADLVTIVAKLNSDAGIPGALEAEMAAYADPAAMEASATSGSHRKHHMFITHDTRDNSFNLAKRWGELDLDVLPTAVALRVASSLAHKVLDRSYVSQALSDISEMSLLRRDLEEAKYNDKFVRALVAENVDASIDEAGAFVGNYRESATDMMTWAQNAHSGFDLPVRTVEDGVESWPSVGCGLASFPMIQSLAEQGEARGYEMSVVNRARKAVRVVRALADGIKNAAVSSTALDDAHVPEWFNFKSPEIAVFLHLYMQRAPLALGIPAGQPAKKNAGRPSRDVPVRRPESGAGPAAPTLWTSTGRNGADSYLSLASVPLLGIALAILGLEEKSTDSAMDTEVKRVAQIAADSGQFVNDPAKTLQLKLVAMFADAAAAAVAEPAVRSLTEKILEVVRLNRGNAAYAKLLVDEVKKVVAARVDKLDISTIEELTAAVDGVKKSVRGMSKTVRALSSADATAAERSGNAIILLSKGVALIPSDTSAFVRANAGISDTIFETLNSKAPGSNSSVADLARSAADAVFVASAKLVPYTGMQFSFGTAEEFVDALATSRAPAELRDAFDQAIAVHKNIESSAQEMVANATASSSASVEVDMLDAGNPLPSDNAVSVAAPAAFFIAGPLVNSMALMRSIAAYKGGIPLLMPADKEANYRYPLVPISGGRVHLPALLGVLSDPAMLPSSNSRTEIGARVFENDSLLQASMDKPVYRNPYPDFRHTHAGTNASTTLGVQIRHTNDNRFVMGENDIEMQAAMDSINADRAAQGLAPSDFSAEFARAALQSRTLNVNAEREQNAALFAERIAQSSIQSGTLIGNTDPLNPLHDTGLVAEQASRAPAAQWDTGAHNAQRAQTAARRAAIESQSAHLSHGRIIADTNGNKFREVDGVLHPIDDDSMAADEPKEALAGNSTVEDLSHPNVQHRHKVMDEQPNALTRLLLRVVYEMPNTSAGWGNAIESDWYAPIKFILWRLHIEFEMYSAIALKSGISTGANVIGHQSIAFTNSKQDRMMLGNMIFWHKTIIFKPENVRHIRNVQPHRYVAGWGTDFIMSADELAREDRRSLIVTAVEVTTRADEQRRLNFLDNSKPRAANSLTNQTRDASAIPDYSGAALAGAQWHLDPYTFSAEESPEPFTETAINTIASRGTYYTWTHRDQEFNTEQKSNGPLSGRRSKVGAVETFNSTSARSFPTYADAAVGSHRP